MTDSRSDAHHEVASTESPAERIAAIRGLRATLGFDFPEHLRLCREGAALAEEIGDTLSLADFLAGEGWAIGASDSHRYTEALPLLSRAVDLFEQGGAGSQAMKVLKLMGHFCAMNHQLVPAVDAMQRALLLAREIDEQAMEVEILSYLGRYLEWMGDNDASVATALQMLAIGEKLDDSAIIADACSELAITLNKCGDHRRAFEFLEREFVLRQKAGDPYEEAICAGVMGDCLRDMGEYQRAVASYTHSLHSARLVEDDTQRNHTSAEALQGLGKTYLKVGDPDRASTALLGSLDLWSLDREESPHMVPALLALAELASQQGEEEQVRNYLDRTLAVNGIDPLDMAEAHMMYADHFERENNPARALQHYREYHRIRGEIADADAKRMLERTQAQVELERRTASLRRKTERMEYELEVARAAQLSMLPSEPPSLDGAVIASLCLPALEVGGDYFDFITLDEGVLGLAIADVAGKGMPAAMHVALLKGVLRSFAVPGTAPRDVLLNVNRHLHDIFRRGLFASMIYAVLDVDARTLCYACAGHNPLLVIRQGEQIAPVRSSGIALGLAPNELLMKSIRERSVALEPGDSIILHTDGVTEAMNREREEYGDHRLVDVALRSADQAPSVIVDALRSDIESFADGAAQNDDITVVAVRLEG